MNTLSPTTFGIVVISVLLSAIIAAFIFSPKFRKDVVASEGEAAVLGLINVKGVIIVLLTAILVGSFVYILKLEASSHNSDIEFPNLEVTNGENIKVPDCQLNIKDDSIFISANGRVLGVLNTEQLQNLKVIKDKEIEFKWNAKLFDKIKLGEINISHDTEFIQNSEGDIESLPFKVHKPYRVSDLNLFFIIDSIQYYSINSNVGYNYWIRFGEGQNSSEVKWLDEPVSYIKTRNASLSPKQSFKCIQHKSWNNMYYIALGLGQPLVDTTNMKYSEVQMLNLNALEISLN